MNVDIESETGIAPFELPRLCRDFCESSPLPMVAVEGSHHVVRHLNPAFAQLAELPSRDLMGRPFAEILQGSVGRECLSRLDQVLQSGNPEKLQEQELHRARPTYWSFMMWAIPGMDEHPMGVMIQITDATDTALFRQRSREMNEALLVSSVRQHELIETIRQGEQARHELEAQLFQAKKLESLGVMAGGIAHDLNNILTPVVGFSALAIESLDDESPAIPMLEEVRKSAYLAAALVQQLLAYVGKGRFVIETIELSHLVSEMRELLKSIVPSHVDLRFEFPTDCPAVEGDATQLREVVLNLVKNAAEASGQHDGTITVRIGTTQLESSTVFLEVHDTGCGMTKDVIENIFEPFFTTKFTGRGLGLAVVQGICRRHQGQLQVFSEPGRGSTFRVVLPASTKIPEAPIVRPRIERDLNAKGTVLIIDDEKAVLGFVALVLKQSGYQVLTAGSGEEGIDVFRKNSARIKYAFVDLTMPGMNGLSTAKALRGLHADLAIILMSGYSVVNMADQSRGLAIAAFVQKPFAKKDLLDAILQAAKK